MIGTKPNKSMLNKKFFFGVVGHCIIQVTGQFFFLTKLVMRKNTDGSFDTSDSYSIIYISVSISLLKLVPFHFYCTSIYHNPLHIKLSFSTP